ncbi:MAG: class I SAM-dependent methyltransferase [Bacteroidales bacterium]
MTYYSPFDMVGTFKNGIRCEDITNLTFENDKFDLIVSSDVLEHVHNIEQAFRESARVLKKGGIHLFTVPIHDGLTFKRCEFVNDELHHIVEPEYHYDPLNKNGCIVFWTFGTDITDYFINEAFKIDIVSGPQGIDKRYLLALKKI